jgi:hypothetical protein
MANSTAAGEVAAVSAVTAPSVAPKGVLVGAVPPLMLKAAVNPGAWPITACDGSRDLLADRSQVFRNLSAAFVLTPRDAGRIQGRQAAYRRLEKLFTEDLKQFAVCRSAERGSTEPLDLYLPKT